MLGIANFLKTELEWRQRILNRTNNLEIAHKLIAIGG